MKRTPVFAGTALVLLAIAGVALTRSTPPSRVPPTSAPASASADDRDASAPGPAASSTALAPNRPSLSAVQSRYRADAADASAQVLDLDAAAREGSSEAADWLAELATHGDLLAVQAAVALGTMSDLRAVPSLARLALAKEVPVLVRGNAIHALGNAGAKERGHDLAGLAADSAEPLRVRQEAALAVGRLGDAADVAVLVRALDGASADRTPSGEQLRISIEEALRDLGTDDARAALRRRKQATLPPTERAFVERALAAHR